MPRSGTQLRSIFLVVSSLDEGNYECVRVEKMFSLDLIRPISVI